MLLEVDTIKGEAESWYEQEREECYLTFYVRQLPI